ncbi:MAG: hypothetical protein DWQ04_02135 [Chloroflexi bacterium]|nr:MAG: hypothetical protein DWQ04_02135 [Chloroflexota bacterium]
MSGWFMLVLGILIGWAIELVIDWYYWRRQKADSVDETEWQNKLNAAETKMRSLNVQLQDALSREPERIVETIIKEVFVEKDRLQDVKGIGKVFANKLQDAGIYTFTQLADSNPERLTEIINPKEWQAIEPEEWIEHARELASNKTAKAV